MYNHPETFEIEIDRQTLRRYLIGRYAFTWVSLATLLMILPVAASFDSRSTPGLSGKLLILGYWAAGLFVASVAGYFTFTHRRLTRVVRDVSLRVEGPYLLVRTYELSTGHWRDRKLHFNIIVHYDVVEDGWMRRYGIQSLSLNTLAGGIASTIVIPAVKNCRHVRDLLTEIDQARENLKG